MNRNLAAEEYLQHLKAWTHQLEMYLELYGPIPDKHNTFLYMNKHSDLEGFIAMVNLCCHVVQETTKLVACLECPVLEDAHEADHGE